MHLSFSWSNWFSSLMETFFLISSAISRTYFKQSASVTSSSQSHKKSNLWCQNASACCRAIKPKHKTKNSFIVVSSLLCSLNFSKCCRVTTEFSQFYDCFLYSSINDRLISCVVPQIPHFLNRCLRRTNIAQITKKVVQFIVTNFWSVSGFSDVSNNTNNKIQL